MVLYFRDEETVAGKGEGVIVKIMPKRGYPWDEEQLSRVGSGPSPATFSCVILGKSQLL